MEPSEICQETSISECPKSSESSKRPFSAISQPDQQKDPNLRHMKDLQGKSLNLVDPTDSVILEKSEENSPETKRQRKTGLSRESLQTASCYLDTNNSRKFVSMRSLIEGFFTKRSCELQNQEPKREAKLTKPQSPTLQTKMRLRRDCDVCEEGERNDRKGKKSASRPPEFVCRKFDPNCLTLNDSRFENGKFKARKMPNYKPIEIKKSEKDCVVPIGFKLKTENRFSRKDKENVRSESLCDSKSLDKSSFDTKIEFWQNSKRNFARYSLIEHKN